ncbi:MAG: hypothetical protein ACE5E0_04015 [Terriglobia bacterium]
MNWYKIRLGLLSALGGAIALAIIGFSWAGWVTAGTAQQMTLDAIVDRLAPICVAQFNQDPEKDQKLKELEETNSWERDAYVEKQGWATMPGEKESDSGVADKCANQIAQITQ